MSLPEETLIAYADGELGEAARAQVEAEMAVNPQIAERIARHRALAQRLRADFDVILNEPVPERLITAARSKPMLSTVTDLDAARAARFSRKVQRWSWPVAAAMAASLIVGVLAGYFIIQPSSQAPIAIREGQWVADGSLARALSEQLASEPEARASIGIGVSFVARSGDYCRTFQLNAERLAGLACRSGEAWQLKLLAQNTSNAIDGTHYRTASSTLPAAVSHAVDEEIAGAPLDAEQEKDARRRSWRR
jgi:anti-sigma factor RsiW